jgi:hypothetical protein
LALLPKEEKENCIKEGCYGKLTPQRQDIGKCGATNVYAVRIFTSFLMCAAEHFFLSKCTNLDNFVSFASDNIHSLKHKLKFNAHA